MGERLERGRLKAAVIRLADGTRTVAEIAAQLGTSTASVNGTVQRLRLHGRVMRAGKKELSRKIQKTLARAIDAMSRTEPNGVSTKEWDAIVIEGTALLQRMATK